MNPMKYVQLAVLVGVIIMMASIKILWDRNQELNKENLILETQAETNKFNLSLLTTLLDDEKKASEAAHSALIELMQEVPDVVYSQSLPPSIQNVINSFHADLNSIP